ncbi:MAG: hypothetical protein Q7Q71_13970 [Verrucomicrobiota bacterium JB023]|nr:hypothetical protein [Verrucomicrobiota bacterium JB023]
MMKSEDGKFGDFPPAAGHLAPSLAQDGPLVCRNSPGAKPGGRITGAGLLKIPCTGFICAVSRGRHRVGLAGD